MKRLEQSKVLEKVATKILSKESTKKVKAKDNKLDVAVEVVDDFLGTSEFTRIASNLLKDLSVLASDNDFKHTLKYRELESEIEKCLTKLIISKLR